MRNPIRPLAALIFTSVVLAACGTIPPATYPVSVTLAGAGSGSVVSSVSIDEGYTDIDTDAGVFESDFGRDWVITLTATADAGSVFDGFSGEDCDVGSSSNTCTLTVDDAKDITATFSDATASLEVTVNTGGAAAGSVVSSPAGIDTAAGDTEETFAVGTPVTLTSTVDAESFAGWTGGQCEGVKTLTCDITIDASQDPIAANFNEATTLAVRIDAESDTAEEFLADSTADPTRWPEGHTYTFSDDLELGFDPTHGPQAIGLRFPNVTVPASANILDAELGFTAFAPTGSGADVALTITGEASTSSATFVGDPNDPVGPNPPSFGVTSLSRTSASVAWTITGSWTDGVEYASPDTASIVREILGLSGWSSGGSLIFIVEPVDDTSTEFRRAYASAVSGNETDAPTLTVQYVALP